MKQKSFFILAGVTGLSLLAAAGVMVGGKDAPAFAESGERLFPGLEQSAEDIARLSITEGDFTMSVERRDGVFVDDASGYPIDPGPLKELVSAMTLAEIAEAKTSDPTRHADLDLAAPDAKDGAGVEVALYGDKGEQFAHIIAGARDFTLGGVTGGQYVRRGGEDAAWLVQGRVDPPTRRSDWFDTRLFDVDASDLASVSLTTENGQVINMTASDGALSIDPSLMTERAPAENQLGRIIRLFETLDFSDVRAVRDGQDAKTGASIEAKLSDGSSITLASLKPTETDEDIRWLRVEIRAGATDGDHGLKDVDGFAFSLSEGESEILGWTLDDLTEETSS